MLNNLKRLRIVPVIGLGALITVLGFLALVQITNNWWPFDVARLDLVRATPQDQADAALILEAGNLEIILTFLASVTAIVTGLALPVVYYLNLRFTKTRQPRYLLVLRQSMWFGAWVAFCIWLQMNRTFGIAIALLVGAVLIIFEILLQVRTRAVTIQLPETGDVKQDG
ncbi:MAG: hypothetical protein IPL78_13735 [Chloroflexi bacterium]|nr:hypothetical protein [Chloroflexota bacterium]